MINGSLETLEYQNSSSQILDKSGIFTDLRYISMGFLFFRPLKLLNVMRW